MSWVLVVACLFFHWEVAACLTLLPLSLTVILPNLTANRCELAWASSASSLKLWLWGAHWELRHQGLSKLLSSGWSTPCFLPNATHICGKWCCLVLPHFSLCSNHCDSFIRNICEEQLWHGWKKCILVCIIYVIPCWEICFELYCNLKDVLINTLQFLLLSCSFYFFSHSGSVRPMSCPCGQRALGPSLWGWELSPGPPDPPPLLSAGLEQASHWWRVRCLSSLQPTVSWVWTDRADASSCVLFVASGRLLFSSLIF